MKSYLAEDSTRVEFFKDWTKKSVGRSELTAPCFHVQIASNRGMVLNVVQCGLDRFLFL